jgi:hypothetical protein
MTVEGRKEALFKIPLTFSNKRQYTILHIHCTAANILTAYFKTSNEINDVEV